MRQRTVLSHWGLHRLIAILQGTFPNSFFVWKLLYLIWITRKFVVKCLIDKKSALIQIMAWRLTGDKPLFELMVAYSSLAHILLGPGVFSMVEFRGLNIYGKIKMLKISSKFRTMSNLPFLNIIIICKSETFLLTCFNPNRNMDK